MNDETRTERELSGVPDDPASALARFCDESREGTPVLVFKKSPICPVSFAAEAAYRAFLGGWDQPLKTFEIDVIAQTPLARGLPAELGVRHASPQALVFRDGALVWHDSHEGLNEEAFRRELTAG